MTARSAVEPDAIGRSQERPSPDRLCELEFDVVRSGDRAVSLGARDGEAILAETDVATARRWRDRFEAALGSGLTRTWGDHRRVAGERR
jgi:hypothetical protein